MQSRNQEELKGQNKINYKQKNLQYIEKLKQKNKKELEQKRQKQKKQQFKRQSLRKKILQEASKNRQNKLKQLSDIQNCHSQQPLNRVSSPKKNKKQLTSNILIPTSSNLSNQKNYQNGTDGLLPKISNVDEKNEENNNHSEDNQSVTNSTTTNNQKTQMVSMKTSQKSIGIQMTPQNQNNNKVNYQNKYIEFLQNLHEANKSKKQIEEKKKKKQQVKYNKIKEQLGFHNIQGKLTNMLQKKTPKQLIRTKSAQKLSNSQNQTSNNLNTNELSQMPKNVKDFKQKNQEYIQKLKRKRKQEEDKKNQQIIKKQKLKQNLKEFVINTVKKNVLDGVYDDEIVDRKQKKQKKQKKQHKDHNENYDDQEQIIEQESSSSQQENQQLKKKRKLRSFPHCSSYADWKKKNRLEEGEKVYIVTGGYPDLQKSLKERGWLKNPDSSSPFFDLKFTLQGRQIDYANLEDYQIVNHFQKNGAITTKIGLTKSLRNLMWINDTSQDNFYPKCFDLNDEDDKLGFQTHFKLCKALSILKIYVDSVIARKTDKSSNSIIQDLKLRTEVALSVCQKNIEDVNEIIDKKKIAKTITDKQWQILAQDQLNQQSLAKKKHEEWLKSIDCKFNGSINNQQKQKKIKKKIKKVKKQKEIQQTAQINVQQNQQDQQEQDQLLMKVKQILNIYEKKFPQFYLTGHNNIWILKPAGLSRGRGITTYNNLVEIQDHMKTKQSQWIAQKYIENPLIIQRRKFDIRQWVLVTNFNPLTIWFYDQCYIRFSAVDYDPKQINNKFIHLCNNSIGAYHKQFKKSHIKGNMFFMEQCRQYLNQKQGYDVFQDKIKPQLKQIVKNSLMCGVYSIQNRKNTNQMFGYDFMVDTNYKVWLLQINSSPSMDYSTHVTTKLVKQVLEDTVKVIIDYQSASKKQKKTIDTGKFKRIYKGIQIPDKTVNTAGLNLCLQGVALKKGNKKNNTVKINNLSLQKK